MIPKLLALMLLIGTSCGYSAEPIKDVKTPLEPVVGAWSFSGMVTNESGDRYGYFFQMQRQGAEFHVKTALIDGQSNELVLFYEKSESIEKELPKNWQVGRSFMRYNSINDSWIFGVTTEQDKGFNFKVDMLKQAKEVSESLVLRPGVQVQALQTSGLNGHIQLGGTAKEQFVTGTNAWFGKLWLSQEQALPHNISTTFCRLDNENGFYSANLKEADATGAAVAGYRDASGNKIKMSQFLTIKTPKENNLCTVHLGVPKTNLKVLNTLKTDHEAPLLIAGFTEQNPKSFCFIAEQNFKQSVS